MRISEWSSDVCSSDLAGGAGCVDDADRIRTFAAVRAIRRVFGDLPEQIGFPVESDEFPVLEHAVEIGGFGLQYGTLGYDRFDMAVRNRIAQAVPDQPRSEEHTSELQSLMRISYAVFCLQKKNKQQLNTRQHNSLK